MKSSWKEHGKSDEAKLQNLSPNEARLVGSSILCSIWKKIELCGCQLPACLPAPAPAGTIRGVGPWWWVGTAGGRADWHGPLGGRSFKPFLQSLILFYFVSHVSFQLRTTTFFFFFLFSFLMIDRPAALAPSDRARVWYPFLLFFFFSSIFAFLSCAAPIQQPAQAQPIVRCCIVSHSR